MEQLEVLGKKILLKLSPFLDIEQACQELEAASRRYSVEKVQVVAYQNEVKELLFCLGPPINSRNRTIEAINLTKEKEWTFCFTRAQESRAKPPYSLPQHYIIEPFAPLLKAGAFNSFAERFGLAKLHPNSHLYTAAHTLEAEELFGDLPARVFIIEAQLPYQKKSLLPYLAKRQAHIQTRNFPDTVPQIRKKMGIQEGGLHYLFATTLRDGQLCLLLCRKI